MKKDLPPLDIKAIIGLGNPGRQYYYNRHNIGFRIVDVLAQKYDDDVWREREYMELDEIRINGKKVILVKPQTFMNASGRVIPYLTKRGIRTENILVIHDELELPFGKVVIRFGGSPRGHNGLRSIISMCGPDFARLRFGIGRPNDGGQVSDYVLQNFSEDQSEIDQVIAQSVELIEGLFFNG